LGGIAARAVALLAPQARERIARRIAPPRLLGVLWPAAVAGELANDVVLEGGAVARAHDLPALGLEVGEALTRALHLVGELDAAGVAPQRAREQELVPAIGAVEL